MLGNNRRRVSLSVLRRRMAMRRRAAVIAKMNEDTNLVTQRQLSEQQEIINELQENVVISNANPVSETVSEVVPETVSEVVPETVSEVVPETVSETVTEPAEEIDEKSELEEKVEEIVTLKLKPPTKEFVKVEEIMKKYRLFWQYPVITEKTFYEQNKGDENYLGLPWATIIDKRYNLELMYKLVKPYVKFKEYYTCCQHISFRKFTSLWKSLGITKVYAVHKVKGEDKINGIEILPCPLYAVNVEDNNRNSKFKGEDYITRDRKYLYSFVGAYNPHVYMSDIRKRIYSMKHPEDCVVEKTNMWHFEKMVYSKMQNSKGELNEDKAQKQKGERYNELLLDSRYTLCPSGSGPNSIRLWEALAVGSIPVLLADTLELPKHELWKDSIVEVNEKDLKNVPEILRKIDENRENEMRKNCLELYKYFKDNYRNI